MRLIELVAGHPDLGAVHVGQIIGDLLLETFIDPATRRIRVRPCGTSGNDLVIEFPKALRAAHPLGSTFRADVKVHQKHKNGKINGRPYLRADPKSIELFTSGPL
jgi:hypothetical protein